MEFRHQFLFVLFVQFVAFTHGKRSADDDGPENPGKVERLHPNRNKLDLFRRPDRFPSAGLFRDDDPDSSPQVLSPSLSSQPYNNGVGGLGAGGLGQLGGAGLQNSYLGAGGLGGIGGLAGNPYLAQQYGGGLGLGNAGLLGNTGLGAYGQQQYLGGLNNPYLGAGGLGLGNSYLGGAGLGNLQGSYLGGGLSGSDLYSGGLGLGGVGGLGSLYGNPYLNNAGLSGFGVGGIGSAGLLGNGVYSPSLYRNSLISAGNPYLTPLNPYSSYSQLNPYNSFPLTSRFGLGFGGGLAGAGTRQRTNPSSSINNSDE